MTHGSRPTAHGLRLDGLTKSFENHVAIRDLTLEVPRAMTLALLGPSGSGKTTTLRLMAGFERPDSGSIWLDGKDVTSRGPAERRFGMVFQHYALFPHLTVGENVAFGLDARRPKEERSRRVREVLELVDLSGFESRDVSELSGGQQQRVAVARALAPEPAVLCLDEPLSNLDPALRERTRRELKSALDRVGVTTVFVTHEQDEAFALGDEIAVLNRGTLEQVGTARELYEHPRSLFVATFVGRGSVLSGRMSRDGRVRVWDGDREGLAVEWAARPSDAAGFEVGSEVRVVVRPEALRLGGEQGMPGLVRSSRYTGARSFHEVETAAGVLEVEDPRHTARIGERVMVTAEWVHVFGAEP